MPVYAYKCENCDYHFDVKQSFSDDPITDCPNCGHKQTVRRIIQPAAVVFKGPGFYVTDNRGKSSTMTSNNGSSENGSSESKSETKAEKSSDAKTEKKADKKPAPKPAD